MELLPTEDLSRARGARGEALALPAGPRRETVPGPGGAGEAAEAIGAGGAAEVGTAAGGAEAAGAGGASVAFGTADAADAPGAALAARRAQLARLGAAIAERREELIAALVVHARKIRRLATREVDFALARLRAFDEVEARLAGRAPVGGVAIVLPGNVGISNPVATIGTAYLAGNRVVARFPGALRDTVLVTPGSRVVVAFDAVNPGWWAMHCHLLYHMDAGMFTTLRYV